MLELTITDALDLWGKCDPFDTKLP
jgi:hypothetical protein